MIKVILKKITIRYSSSVLAFLDIDPFKVYVLLMQSERTKRPCNIKGDTSVTDFFLKT